VEGAEFHAWQPVLLVRYNLVLTVCVSFCISFMRASMIILWATVCGITLS
jgi:hypothetical protein